MRWEYKLCEGTMSVDDLCELGLSGWELAGIVLGGVVDRHMRDKFYFKRPKVEVEPKQAATNEGEGT